MLDYHLHLWPHGEPARGFTVEDLAARCDQAARVGITQIAVTEHLFRFRQAEAALAGFWDDDPDPALRRTMAEYWTDHATADLDTYVEVVLAGQRAGLPVVLGLEVDHYAGRMDRVAALLDGYPFDVLLGSVHWIGAWGFDNWTQPAFGAEWDARTTESVWDAYATAVEELAASGVCDVLAHPDLCKVTGRVPGAPGEFHDRLAESVSRAGMAAEVSSAGWRKPVAEPYPSPPLLRRFRERDVPVTTAADAHVLEDVGVGVLDLRPLLDGAGYDGTTAFDRRVPRPVPLGQAVL